MVEEIRSIRTRTCDPKRNENPRYLRLSNAVSALLWVADDLRREQESDSLRRLCRFCGSRLHTVILSRRVRKMERTSVDLRDGRRVVHVVGSNTQTVNICTMAGQSGDYEIIYRLLVVEDVQSADIADLSDVVALEEWLLDHGGIPEHRPGGPGARLWPLIEDAVDPQWMTSASSAVEGALDDFVTEFLDKPYLHRVEHSLHAELYRCLKEHQALRG